MQGYNLVEMMRIPRVYPSSTDLQKDKKQFDFHISVIFLKKVSYYSTQLNGI